MMLVLGSFAASPALHPRRQIDSNHPNHSCILCTFAAGQLDAAETTPVVAAACLLLLCGVPASAPALVSLFDFSFSPSRAPPRL
ncbi:MAG: hypothetical protein ACLQM8_03895 [Limisphaerales bacterium]